MSTRKHFQRGLSILAGRRTRQETSRRIDPAKISFGRLVRRYYTVTFVYADLPTYIVRKTYQRYLAREK